MSKAWPLVKLGEVLHKSQNWIELDPQQEYKEVTVRLWGKGVTLRGMVTGSQIAGSRRLQVHTNQFILSLSKTNNLLESCKTVSEGTTNRVRLKERNFSR
ncbi:MAG: hypothetical protein IPK63_10640 [Candidatus Competibacteraceae bacterium]|nr:hypothetical protein [Candidatus Competibacteraceae bacterium]